MKHLLSGLLILLLLASVSCGGGGGSSDNVSKNYPYLKSAPVVTYSQSTWDTTKHDVTVTVEADGPDGVFAIGLWIFSKDDDTIFDSLDLSYIGGTTWIISTNPYLPLPPGNYYIDSIMLEDADKFSNTVVKSSWYLGDPLLGGNNYTVDQRVTDWSTVTISDVNIATSDIKVVNFTLPVIP